MSQRDVRTKNNVVASFGTRVEMFLRQDSWAEIRKAALLRQPSSLGAFGPTASGPKQRMSVQMLAIFITASKALSGVY